MTIPEEGFEVTLTCDSPECGQTWTGGLGRCPHCKNGHDDNDPRDDRKCVDPPCDDYDLCARHDDSRTESPRQCSRCADALDAKGNCIGYCAACRKSPLPSLDQRIGEGATAQIVAELRGLYAERDALREKADEWRSALNAIRESLENERADVALDVAKAALTYDR